MADLYVSALGRAMRAVVATAGGRQIALRAADSRSAEATSIESLAIDFRKQLAAAEMQSDEGVQRLVCVVPGGLDAQERAMYTQAALLAGARDVAVLDLESVAAEAVVSGGTALLIEAHDDRTAITVVDRSESEARCLETTQVWSLKGLRSIFAAQLFPEGLPPEGAPFAEEATQRWLRSENRSAGWFIMMPSSDGEPGAAFLPTSFIDAAEETLCRCFFDSLVALGVERSRVQRILVTGSWASPLAGALSGRFPGAQLKAGPSIELDAALRQLPPRADAPKHCLSADICATSNSGGAARAAGRTTSFTLLARGTALPAYVIKEDFESRAFLGSFSISSVNEGGEIVPWCSIPIPRFAERQPFSYLRVGVHCDTADLALIEVDYLFSPNKKFIFYDKRSQTQTEVSQDMFDRIHEGSA